jgi:phospholipid-binding lipoprotein MlaA
MRHQTGSRTYARLALGLAAALLSGCASGPRASDPRDPFEPYNRVVYRFNTDFHKAFVDPAARVYKTVTPEVVDRGVTNVFGNFLDVTSFANNVLQFKMSRATSDLGRIFLNSTVGVLGFFDVATNMGLPSYKEDFGQTLGYWGMEPGPYFVLPLLGPCNIRDTVGWAGDIVTDPFFSFEANEILWGMVGLRYVDRRADLLAAAEILEDAAVDPYVFVRDAYTQRRRNLVYDGNPPPEEGEEDIWKDVDLGPGPAPSPPAESAPPPGASP